jgi:D-psicose/D-tagatose/L-ribulose 3-epimerase
MKKCISNIAWDPNDNDSIVPLLKKYDIKNIEVAPKILFDNPLKVSKEQILVVKEYWNNRGINIYGMQALLYGNPHLKIFDTTECRKETSRYLKEIINLAGQLGVKRMVFGSPRNRYRQNLKIDEAQEIASKFFWDLSETCRKNDVILCLEPNAKGYGCNFINNTTQALDLIRCVDHDNFKLNMDTSTLIMNGENVTDCIVKAKDKISHFHISYPNLLPITNGTIDFSSLHTSLKKVGYDGAVSVEMRPTTKENIRSALHILKKNFR